MLNVPLRHIVVLLWLVSSLAACEAGNDPTATSTTSPVPTEDFASLVGSVTPIPTADVPTTAAPTVPPTATLTASPAPDVTTTASPAPSAAVVALAPASATVQPAAASRTQQVEARESAGELPPARPILQRPIPRRDDRVDWVDRTYPYGGTQFGNREVHLGVEFVNPRFTPVLAAAAGRVVFAGNDEESLIGPRTGYYGDVVIIEHDLPSLDGSPVYTLYGHLQHIDVAADQEVEAGEKIGGVGDSGIAIGPHLHFEVRVGDPFDYRMTRNPELWLRPYPQFGTLAGRVMNAPETTDGMPIQVRSAEVQRETYTYGGDRVNSDPALGENFTLGDLPVGVYEVIISNQNGRVLFREEITIENGETTFVEIDLTNP